jgi:3'-5' exoribonuclease
MALPKPLYAFVVEEKARPTRQGRWFHQANLRTNHGTIKANMWNAHQESEKDTKFPHVGDIIEVSDFVDQLETHQSIVINVFKRITKDQLPQNEKSICEFPQADPNELKEALEILSDKSIWSDPKYYKFIMACLSKLDKETLKICPAAMQIHHAYAGGLLVHTAEVLKMCQGIMESTPKRYGFINTDVLYAAAILHDIGKVRTYHINELGIAEISLTERIIGHIYYGMELAAEAGKECDIEPEFVNEVVHCVAAHHGTVMWGSIKEVQSVEAGILSRADYISSRNGMVEARLQENVKSGQPLQENFSIYNDPYFASIGMKRYVQSEITSI